MALPIELRERAVEAYRQGEGSQRAIAKRFKIARQTLVLWLELEEKNDGDLRPRKPGGNRSKLDEEDRHRLRQLVQDNKDATEQELADLLFHATGTRVSRATIGVHLRSMGLSRKKRHGEQANLTKTPSKS